MRTGECEIGMVGLGVMGRNLLLNMADHGHAVAGWDRMPEAVEALAREGGGRIAGAAGPPELVALLRKPRAIMMLVPAGPAVDEVIGVFAPLLDPGDILVDAGNSHFRDTDRRIRALAEKRIGLLGVGISGGEYGARHGASIMPGGALELYERVRPVLESAAASAGGAACIAYLGPGSAGHYVKMVHNGIEYAMIQLIAEAYDLMRRGAGMELHAVRGAFDGWNRAELNGYLVATAARVLGVTDGRSGEALVDRILDEAGQLGTGTWASQDAMELGVPTPSIDAAIAARNLSRLKGERTAASALLAGPPRGGGAARSAFTARLGGALHAAFIVSFAQGMAQLAAASRARRYALDLEDVARIWRGGCIIRAALLDGIVAAYRARPDLPNLLLDRAIGGAAAARHGDLRAAVSSAAALGIPAPSFGASLAYYDGYRSARLPADLIQALRDCFGAHGFRRLDEGGTFHSAWDDGRGGER